MDVVLGKEVWTSKHSVKIEAIALNKIVSGYVPPEPKYDLEWDLLPAIRQRLQASSQVSIACKLYEENKRTVAVSCKEGTGELYASILFKKEKLRGMAL